jgi:glutaredoxin
MVRKLTPMTITMYGADCCGDCRRAEKFFVDNNIDFQKVDLELDENEHFVESEVLRRNNGKKAIPVIVFDDDSHPTEPTNAQLAEKLGLLKY